jgi:hypothetical protein
VKQLAELNDFQKAMVALDVALTGTNQADAAHMVSQQYASIEAWLDGGEWYLSDCGYSRLWLTEEKLFVTDNSTSKVKANWPKAGQEIETVKVLIREYFQSHGHTWKG